MRCSRECEPLPKPDPCYPVGRMRATTLLGCTARPTTLHAHWSNLAGGVVLIVPMVHIEGTSVFSPWLIDAAHCLDTENRPVWNGRVCRLLGTEYHQVPDRHHLASVLTEIANRKPGKRCGLPALSPFELPDEAGRYLSIWRSFVGTFTWGDNKSYVLDQTQVWLCVNTSLGCWRLQQVRGVVDPAYSSPSDWLAFDRPRSTLKRTESEEGVPPETKSPKKKKSKLSRQT